MEELIRYLEPDRWQLDLEDLYRPTWQLLGKAYIHGRKSRGKLLFCLALQFSTGLLFDEETVIKSILQPQTFDSKKGIH